MVKRDNSPAAVQSVDRALLVLEILAGMGQAGVTEIAEEICVHKIDGVATDRGAGGTRIRRAGLRTRQVSTGFAVARLARASSAQLDMVKVSQDVCDELSVDVGETVHLAVRDLQREGAAVRTGSCRRP